MNVLLAEDESIIRMDLRETLERRGYRVVGEASDGDEAVRLAEELRPDAVLLDIKMPGRTGLAAAEEIRRRKIAPCVILTAYHDAELVREAGEAGAYTFLIKPFDERELVAALELACSRYGELRDAEIALDERKWIDRAKGLLMDRHRLKEAEAFGVLRKRAMDTRKSVADVAREILSAPPSRQDRRGGPRSE